MAGKRNDINQNSVFLARFAEEHMKKPRTLDELAAEFGVVRQTVSHWFIGDSTPNIGALLKMCQFYGVSADYLLGLSDTRSSDVNVKAAMEYTGLSETAVERIHNGFVKSKHFRRELSEEAKKEKMLTASGMIISAEFSDVLDHLCILEERSLFERILVRAKKQYCNYEDSKSDDSFSFQKEKDREYIIQAVRDARQKGRLFQEEQIEERLAAMSDEELLKFLEVALSDNKDKMDLQQFMATKSFTRYVDWLLDSSYGKIMSKLVD